MKKLMNKFEYRALEQSGKIKTGSMQGNDQQSVLKMLKEKSLIPLEVRKHGEEQTKMAQNKKIKPALLLLFTRQFHSLLKAGIPIVSALRALKDQTKDVNFRAILSTMIENVEQGCRLSESLEKYTRVFPAIYRHSIRIGELSGTLEDTLSYLYLYYENEIKIRKEVKKAIRYPLTVVVGIIGAMIIIITKVIPNFIPIFEASNQVLPLPTRILLIIHDLFSNYASYLGFLLVVGAIALFFYARSERGGYQLDYIFLNLPVFGSFFKKVTLTRFSKLLYTMNKTGIPIMQSFEIMQKTIDNRVYSKELKFAGDRIVKGISIGESLSKSEYFTPLLIEMISIGEKSGSMDEMLKSISEYYDRDISETVTSMTTMIEPVVTIVLGGLILFLALAIFLPMWDMMQIM
jgi:type IV pilus assembly protein PilC